ncbi:GNAT family N-acetyltransferase [Streptomyces sp. NPDC002067]
MSERIDPRRGTLRSPDADPEAPAYDGTGRLEGHCRTAGTAQLAEAGPEAGVLPGDRGGALAAPPLSPLAARQRERVTRALADAGQLPPSAAPAVSVDVLDPDHPDAVRCLGSYVSEMNGLLDGGFDPANSLLLDPEALRAPRGLFLVVRLHGTPVGCAGLKLPAGAPAEIKRLWISPRARGLGLARRLLAELEGHAARRGRDLIRLETNNALKGAIRLYRSSGYVEIPAFNDEPYAHLWFAKPLSPRGAEERKGHTFRPHDDRPGSPQSPAPVPAPCPSGPPPSVARARSAPSAPGRCRNSAKSPTP